VPVVIFSGSPADASYFINPVSTNISAIAGKWYVHFIEGNGEAISNFRDCVTLKIEVSELLNDNNYNM